MNSKHRSRQSALTLGMIGLLLGVVAVGSANIAFALGPANPGEPQPGTPNFTMTFDENGNATINGGPAPVFAAGGGLGVEYILPGPVVPGVVFVGAPGDVGPFFGNDSDYLNFVQAGPTGGLLQYLSLIDDPSTDLADASAQNVIRIIGSNLGNSAIITETGPEGNNGFVWSTGGTVYQGISDIPTPEPSTFILGGLGLIALFLIGRRRGLEKD